VRASHSELLWTRSNTLDRSKNALVKTRVLEAQRTTTTVALTGHAVDVTDTVPRSRAWRCDAPLGVVGGVLPGLTAHLDVFDIFNGVLDGAVGGQRRTGALTPCLDIHWSLQCWGNQLIPHIVAGSKVCRLADRLECSAGFGFQVGNMRLSRVDIFTL
jgi:hypothetical protein